MYGQSIENTYRLLSGEVTFEQLIMCVCYLVIDPDDEFPEDKLPVFFVDPSEYPTVEDIDEMIRYFEKYEDYEKCQFLKEFKINL